MKNLFKTPLTFIGALLLACFVSSGSARAQVTSTDLLVGGTVVGHVDAFILDGQLFMDIYTEGTYTIDSAKTAVGWTLGDIPTDSRGNPSVAQFPFVELGGEGVQDIFTIIPLDSTACDIPLVLATQVTVRNAASGCDDPKKVWAGNLPFPCVADDDSDDSCRDSDRESRHRDCRDSDRERHRSDCRDRDDRDSQEHKCQGKDGQDQDRRDGRECSKDGRRDCKDQEHDRKNCRDNDEDREQCRSRDRDRKDCDGRDGHHRDHGDREDDEDDDDSDSCGNATYMLVGCLFSDSDGGGPVF